MNLFILALLIFAAGAICSLAFGRGKLACAAGALAAASASCAGLWSIFSADFATVTTYRLNLSLPLGAFTLGLDPLTRLFLLPTFGLGLCCAVSGALALEDQEHEHHLGAHWFFINLLLLTLSLMLASRDGVLFIFSWEVMSVTPFFLISFYDLEEKVREASWIYVVAAHLGGVFLVLLFAWLIAKSGASDFSALAKAGQAGPYGFVLFCLALLGFGAKSGIIPMHVWLPEGYASAPSHVSALISGALTNAGIYGLARTLTWFGPAEPSWGFILLGLGLCSAGFGILMSLVQRNLKRLLAYSSVENMGIILAGLGVWLIGRESGNTYLALLGFGGALMHVLNHSAFKSLLFLAAGEVLHSAGTIRLEHLGGLQKRLPLLGAIFLTGSAAIAGLPPLNGFCGEVLIYLGLAKGMELGESLSRMGFMAGFFGLSVVGGLALATFSKAYGLAFLGEPRSGAAQNAQNQGYAPLVPPLILALVCVFLGLFSPWVFRYVSLALPGSAPDLAPALESAALVLEYVVYGGLGFCVLLAGLAWVRLLILRKRAPRTYKTWNCGYLLSDPRIQYSQASFAEPLTKLFGSGLGLSERLNPPQGYFPTQAELKILAPDRVEHGFFGPLFDGVGRFCDAVKLLQHGRIHLYILYILAVLIGLLCLKL